MPPPKCSKKPEGASKKGDQKKKEKLIEDKTFGLKNKKGAKGQKFVKMVATQVKFGGQSARKLELAEKAGGKKEDLRKKQQEELNMLFKPVEQKVAKGVDPKSVVCAFFKAGQCKKGAKCKFSHDLAQDRKAEKRSIYDDGKEKEEGMENWDEAKLEDVVNEKHGEQNKQLTTTTIICKYFLDAVEGGKYGWFWLCPNGENCKYRHALPPGFILKKDKQRMDDQKESFSLEELIEKERAALGANSNLTRVTLETFLKWKDRKKRQKVDKHTANMEKKKTDFYAGKAFGISGRMMFEFNPDLVEGDDEMADDVTYQRESDEEEDAEGAEDGKLSTQWGNVREISLEALAAYAQESDNSGTIAKGLERLGATSDTLAAENDAKRKDEEANKLDMAGALPPDQTQAAIDAAMAATVNGDVLADDIPIDENLFDGEDMDDIDDELDTLELDD